jgi:hypothetical protein
MTSSKTFKTKFRLFLRRFGMLCKKNNYLEKEFEFQEQLCQMEK